MNQYKDCFAALIHGYDGQGPSRYHDCTAAGETAMNKQIWVGLVEVKPQPGCEMLKEGKGAFVHTMAWAEDAVHFKRVLARCFGQMKMEVTEVRQPEPWVVRSQREDELLEGLSQGEKADELQELFELAEQISKDEAKVAFGMFHAWLKDDLTNKR